ncbi:hypothetical protein LX32DRAFT_277234 [Colletotrichum zoysiae]|uniref:Uncharacterized protein n=1 Tax=Colletotrichum zoysiae TaxID=1216348 RepID=A0AAD9H3F8_9PEZI|nr:hypothetical protein LX32DRAFT_277234 [Colletotrichum zoysiae]
MVSRTGLQLSASIFPGQCVPMLITDPLFSLSYCPLPAAFRVRGGYMHPSTGRATYISPRRFFGAPKRRQCVHLEISGRGGGPGFFLFCFPWSSRAHLGAKPYRAHLGPHRPRSRSPSRSSVSGTRHASNPDRKREWTAFPRVSVWEREEGTSFHCSFNQENHEGLAKKKN